MFDPNSGFMYAVVAAVIVFVIAESVYFLVRAVRRGKELGVTKEVMKSTAVSSAIFTVAPAIAILIGVITLSKSLGLPLPWLRLTVIGALTYEVTAAETAASAIGESLSHLITDARAFSTIAWVMTIGIIIGLFLLVFFAEKLENGLLRIKTKDEKWGNIFLASLFLGMISAFLGSVFSKIRTGLSGWIPVFVMLSSAIIMLVCGAVQKKTGARWLSDYALPISLLGAMALAIPITSLVSALA
ncbi:MAG: DUF5058 family protein [Oscillospiraceae bacterium]|nr:DUF5058 family protein [Oscillospiraceae bacterium]